MKHIARFLIPVVGIVLLSSCYVMSVRPTGSIRINLGQPSGRAISASAAVRLYLYTYSSPDSHSLYIFPSGKQYEELTYGTGTQTISGIPEGLWQVLVSIGSDGPNTSFQATRYGASPVIQVLGGASSGASVQTVSSPLTYSSDLAGLDLNGLNVGQSTGYVYASTTDMLYQGSIAIVPSGSTSIAGVPTTMPQVSQSAQIAGNGLQINSIDAGYYYYSGTALSVQSDLFVNTNKGIVLYDTSNGFDATFSQYLNAGNPYSVLQSAAVERYPGSTPYEIAVFYRRAQGLGGVYLTASYTVPTVASGKAPWIDVNLPSSTGSQTVYDVVANDDGGANPIVYFATAGGAFRSDLTLIQYGSTAAQNLGQYANYFSAPDNSTIHSMAILNGDLFIATTTGVYYGTLQESNLAQPPVSSWTKISGLSNDGIQEIAPRIYYDTMQVPHLIVAMRSSDNLYIFDASKDQVSTYPFYAGLPGKLHSIAWFGSLLLVAGSQGLAGIQIAPVAPFSGL